MNISVFGKSGPSDVTLGLVCACTATDALAMAARVATATSKTRKVLDNGMSPGSYYVRIYVSIAQGGADCAGLDRGRQTAPCPRTLIPMSSIPMTSIP